MLHSNIVKYTPKVALLHLAGIKALTAFSTTLTFLWHRFNKFSETFCGLGLYHTVAADLLTAHP